MLLLRLSLTRIIIYDVVNDEVKDKAFALVNDEVKALGSTPLNGYYLLCFQVYNNMY